MKSEIINIRMVHKSGAFGNRNSYGSWIYGTRPDGKTVACRSEDLPDGGIRIFSFWESPDCCTDEITTCETEFTKDEWNSILIVKEELQTIVSNSILRSRTQI